MDEERRQRVVDLFEDCVQTELAHRNELDGYGLDEVAIQRMMFSVTAAVLYAFDIDWNPNWVKAGQVHHWEESDTWFARCGVCLVDSMGSPSKADATAWARRHEASHANTEHDEHPDRSHRDDATVTKACCSAMRDQIEYSCLDHPDLSACPDSLVTYWGSGGYVLRVHDGGSSGIAINYCPWCGSRL